MSLLAQDRLAAVVMCDESDDRIDALLQTLADDLSALPAASPATDTLETLVAEITKSRKRTVEQTNCLADVMRKDIKTATIDKLEWKTRALHLSEELNEQ
jgi:hypothetical protein